MRWDWQIGRVTPLERAGKRAVDIYDIDGFLTTRAEVTQLHTTWQASTLPHPKAFCYLDLAWEDYRPDASPAPRGAFPADTLGNVYYGYPQERWVDFRQLDALEPMIDGRIEMCAEKGFDSVELDDIDSFDPPRTTGFQLTPGDAQNFLAWVDNDVHEHGMTVLWKNSPYLSWWGRRYTDGAVVEECYVYSQCFSSEVAREQPVRLHVHAGVGPDPVRVGRLQHRPYPPPADRQVGWRDRVRRRSLRLQSRPGVHRPPQLCRLLPSGLLAAGGILGGQARRRPRRARVLPVPEGSLIRSQPTRGSGHGDSPSGLASTTR